MRGDRMRAPVDNWRELDKLVISGAVAKRGHRFVAGIIGLIRRSRSIDTLETVFPRLLANLITIGRVSTGA